MSFVTRFPGDVSPATVVCLVGRAKTDMFRPPSPSVEQTTPEFTGKPRLAVNVGRAGGKRTASRNE